jgi:hypothetical protein
VADPAELPLPEWILAALRCLAPGTVSGQKVAVDSDWWRDRLAEAGFGDELFDAPDGFLSRDALFELGKDAANSPEEARRLLWASLSWGTGMRQRNNRSRIRAVQVDADRLGKLLAQAAAAGRQEAATAYEMLRPYRNAIPYLGPPFFTKFLYFAGAREPQHPCLILDSRVAATLRSPDGGWTCLTGWYSWPAATYRQYSELVHRWTATANAVFDAERSGRAVWPDEIEYVLFKGRTYFEGCSPAGMSA